MKCKCSPRFPVRPPICPLVGGDGGANGGESVEGVDEAVNPKHVLLGEPSVGEKVVTLDASGPGVLKPKLLPAPKGMTEAQWAEHCVSHVKYSDACPFCVACRRPNAPHKRSFSESSRRLPLLVADY